MTLSYTASRPGGCQWNSVSALFGLDRQRGEKATVAVLRFAVACTRQLSHRSVAAYKGTRGSAAVDPSNRRKPMEFGFGIPTRGPMATPESIAALAHKGE